MSGVAECVILVGLPGAGKSTFFRQRFAGTHDHVSKDAMPHNRHRERRQAQLITEALAAGRSVVVDNTHPSAAARAGAIAIASRHRAEVVGYLFPIDVRDAVRRNRARTGRERVPDVAIFTTRKRLELPSYEEGFDRLFVVTPDEASPYAFAITLVERLQSG
jgi:predicted kinase